MKSSRTIASRIGKSPYDTDTLNYSETRSSTWNLVDMKHF